MDETTAVKPDALSVLPPADTLPAPTFGARMQLQTLSDAMAFAKIVHASGMAPLGAKGQPMTPEAIVICIQMGYEVGLSPMQALQNIASINNKPAIYGDAQLALVRASGKMETYNQEPIGDPGTDTQGYRVTVKRINQPAKTEEFTVADARKAQLWGKQGPWTQYPKRMLLFRARGFLLRDEFGDVLKGLRSVEEVMDEPRDITAEVEVHAPATPPESRLKRSKAPPADAPADLKPAEKPAAVAGKVEAEPEKAAPEVPTKVESAIAALESVKVTEKVAIMYFQAGGNLTGRQGLQDLPEETLAYIVANPAAVKADITKWADGPEEGAK